MKPYPLKLLTLALSADIATSFIPTSRPGTSIYRARVKNDAGRSLATNSNVETSSSADEKFPFEDNAVRFAYDEWRLMHGKGAFDPVRFEPFKDNFTTLTTANLKARNQAFAEGKQPPKWMTLNEYGDFSIAEYEAMRRGESLPVAPPPSVPHATPQPVMSQPMQTQAPSQPQESGFNDEDRKPILEMEKSVPLLEVNGRIDGGGPLDPDQVEHESSSQALYQSSWTAYEEWCENYGKELDAIRFATFSNNYVAMRDSAQNSGKELKLNKYADCTKEEYSLIINGPSPDETSRQKAAEEANIAIQKAEAASIPEASASTAPPRSTQVIKTADRPPFRPTEVIKRSDQPPVRATEVIKRADEPPVRPTEVIRRVDEPPVRRTIVIDENKRKTELIDENEQDSEERSRSSQPDESRARGTVVIRKKDEGFVQGTRVIQKKDEGSFQGTRVIRKNEQSGVAARGTIVVKKNEQESGKSPFSFPFFGSSNDADETDDANSRGTIVIKRQSPQPKPAQNPFGLNIFGTSDQKKGLDDVNRGTVVIQRSQTEPEAPSLFSFFGGTKKKSSKASSSVRGTIVLKNNGKWDPVTRRKETVLIKKSELGGTVPSIFSFFGGAKKTNEMEAARDPNARATLVVKKPRNDWTSAFSMFDMSSPPSQEVPQAETNPKDALKAAQLERQRLKMLEMKQKREAMEAQKEEKRRELEQKRLEVVRARKERMQAATTKGTTATEGADEKKQPFSFFGNPQSKSDPHNSAPKDVPEVRRWKQNSDGSITGYIHNSKNFKDGTRVTTSPVPIGSRNGSVVKTGSGSQYLLK